jgi:hypothetical protein
MGACSSTSSPPPATPDAQATCPTTPEETIGVACAFPGLTCGPEYTCGTSTVALLCVCTAGTFQCVDGTGAAVAPDASLACPGTPATSACPTTETTAELATCTEQGLICSYLSSCPGMLDQCQCAAGATVSGGFGLRFECNPLTCVDGGPPVDAAPPVDAGPSVDATLPADAGGRGSDAGAEGGLDAGADGAMAADAGATPARDATSDAPLPPGDAATADALTE